MYHILVDRKKEIIGFLKSTHGAGEAWHWLQPEKAPVTLKEEAPLPKTFITEHKSGEKSERHYKISQIPFKDILYIKALRAWAEEQGYELLDIEKELFADIKKILSWPMDKEDILPLLRLASLTRKEHLREWEITFQALSYQMQNNPS